MKYSKNLFRVFRYACLVLVVAVGLATIVGTGGNGGSSNGNGDMSNNENGSPDVDKEAPDRKITNSLDMDFVYIEPGTFMMGGPAAKPGRWTVEGTQHQVTLTQGYYMQKTEVTQGQWEAVMGSNPSRFSSCGSDCPVENVSWYRVQDFISALNAIEGTDRYALPTEAQWEYAARAGTNTSFANGDITQYDNMWVCNYDAKLDAIGWYCYNSNRRTHQVSQKIPNAWGLYDMHGNVWEWVADFYGNYPSSAVIDPMGPSSGTFRVIRGGSFANFARRCRSAYRIGESPDFRESNIGFRLVLHPGGD